MKTRIVSQGADPQLAENVFPQLWRNKFMLGDIWLRYSHEYGIKIATEGDGGFPVGKIHVFQNWDAMCERIDKPTTIEFIP